MPQPAPPAATSESPPFQHVLTSEADLRALHTPPSQRALDKQIDRLDDHCRTLIAHAPLVLLATSFADGRCDVAPRGGPPGFVQVLDDTTLAFAELPGNRRFDSLSNLLSNPRVGLLFLIPGMQETLRVNGRGWLVRDPEVLDRVTLRDRRPTLAVGVRVEEAFIHCAKALMRSRLWEPGTWPDRADLPSMACILRDHARLGGEPLAEIEAGLEHSYRTTLY